MVSTVLATAITVRTKLGELVLVPGTERQEIREPVPVPLTPLAQCSMECAVVNLLQLLENGSLGRSISRSGTHMEVSDGWLEVPRREVEHIDPVVRGLVYSEMLINPGAYFVQLLT